MKKTITYKIYAFLFLLSISAVSIKAANFTSAANNVAWNVGSSWTFTGIDADGIPDGDDNIIIQAGHQINLTANASCTNLTIIGTLNLASFAISTFGHFTLNSGGTFTSSSSSAIHLVRGLNKNFTVNGNVGSLIKFDFVLNTNITSGTNFTTSNTTDGRFTVRSGVTVNNSGNVILNNIGVSGLGTWNNLSGSSLTLGKNATITNLNASAVSNTVTYNAGATAVKAPTSSYNNLVINGNKTIPANMTITGNLTVNSGTTNFQNFSLNLAGNLSGTGSVSNINIINFNGTSSQTVSSNSTLALTAITSSNSAGVSITSGTYTVSDSLSISAGNLNAGSNLITLLSNSSKTCYIGNGAGTISGSMIVQRYINARTAGYSEFSSPVGSTTIDDWDDELYMTIGAADNGDASYPGGDGSLNNGFMSVTEYNTAFDTYDPVTTGTTLQVGKGYNIWIADDETSFPGRAIDSRGTPNTGTANITVAYDVANPAFPGWNLIGNPNHAFITWNAFYSANSSKIQNYGQIYDGSGNYTDLFPGDQIPPDQGFWVEVLASQAPSTSVSISQNMKVASTSSLVYRSAKNNDFNLRLSSNTTPFYHEIKINFDDANSTGFDAGNDVPFIKSREKQAPSITFVDGKNKFIRNKMNTESSIVVLPLEISTPIAGNYSIDLEGLLSNGIYTEAYLVNNITKEKIEINNIHSANIYFDKNEVNNNYSLVLKKSNSIENVYSESISIFSTSENIIVKGSSEFTQKVRVEVFNIVGQLVMSAAEELVPNSKISLPTSDLQSEVYIVKVTTSNNQQFTNKVIVTK